MPLCINLRYYRPVHLIFLSAAVRSTSSLRWPRATINEDFVRLFVIMLQGKLYLVRLHVLPVLLSIWSANTALSQIATQHHLMAAVAPKMCSDKVDA